MFVPILVRDSHVRDDYALWVTQRSTATRPVLNYPASVESSSGDQTANGAISHLPIKPKLQSWGAGRTEEVLRQLRKFGGGTVGLVE